MIFVIVMAAIGIAVVVGLALFFTIAWAMDHSADSDINGLGGLWLAGVVAIVGGVAAAVGTVAVLL